MAEVTAGEMEDWVMATLVAHPGPSHHMDRIVAQRLAPALAEFVNANRRDGGPTCSSCDEPSVVKLGRTPFCVAHFGAALRALRQGLDDAIAEGSPAP